MAKGLVTSITANQARSYDRLNRNGKSRKAVVKSTRTGAGDEPGFGGRPMTTRKTTRKKARKARRTPAQKAATRKMIAAAKRARASKKRSLKSNPRKRKAAKKTARRTARKVARKTTRRTTRKLKSNKRTTRRKPARKSARKAARKTTRRTTRKLKSNKRGKRAGARKSTRKTARKSTRRAGARKGSKVRRGPIFLSRLGMSRNPVSPEVAAAYAASTKAGYSYPQPKRMLKKGAPGTKSHRLAGVGIGGGHDTGDVMESYGEAMGSAMTDEQRAKLAALQAKTAVAAAYRETQHLSMERAKVVAAEAAAKAEKSAEAATAQAAEAGATPQEKKAAAKAAKEAAKSAKAAEKAAAAQTAAAARKAAADAKAAEKKAKADAAAAKAAKWHRLMPRQHSKRVGFKYGKYKSLVAKVGKHTLPTYVYEGKGGGLRHIPVTALVGAKPRDKRPEVLAAIEKLKKARTRGKLNPFVPNKRGSAHVISFAQWKKLKANSVHTKGKGKYNRRRHQIAQSLYNELKMHGAKHEKRLRTSALAYVTSYVSHGPKKHNNIKREKAVKDVKEVQSFLGIRRFPSFGNINKAFKFKRNPGMATFVSTVKAAAPLTGGFAAALVLTKFASDALHDALAKSASTSKVAPYAGLISSVLVPAVGAAATARVDALPSKDQVAAGMIAAGILGVVKNGLALAGQGKAAGYLSGLGANYTNAGGSALPNYLQGVGSYYPTSGLGSYFTTTPAGQVVPQRRGMGAADYLQAAAGLGAGNDVATQAAAGMGEYFAPKGSAGLGQYETRFKEPAAGLGVTKEGIMPNTHAAETALQFAEAAAGLGDLPLVSTDEPVDTYVPVDDAPEGSRAGVFTGGDGIFG